AIREQAWDEGREEGREEGQAVGLAKSICILLESVGELSEDVKAKLMTERDIEQLTEWLRLTNQVKTIEEFCVKAGL
ncbi:MAG: hypothetical protein IJ411_05440, partial [Oscillospiraceae bacterium]|nr:hypothetical protein [Oscillospiraceae bacterium]